MLARSRASPELDLIRALRSARGHWWRRTIVDALQVALVVACVGLLVAWVRSWYSGGPEQLLSSGPDLVRVALAAGVCLATWLAVSVFRAPTLLGMARRIDRLERQAERFATGLEVLAAGGPATAVSAALITDLGERVARLHMGSVGWARRWGRTFSIAALLGIIVCGPLLVLPVPTRTFSEAGSSVTRELTLPVDVEVATLAGVAELLELVAEQEGSEYLRAVAASFAELAERLGANSVTDAEADRTARELAEHLRAASRDAGGDFARVVEEAFSRPALTASPAAEAPTAEEPVEAPRTSDGAHEELVRVPLDEMGDEAALTYASLNSLVEQFETDPRSLGIRSSDVQDGSAFVDCFSEGVFCDNPIPNSPTLSDTSAGPVPDVGGGLPIGAAQRSNDAPGDAVGRGATELGGGSDAFLDQTAQGGGLALLPLNQREEGEFVATELVPEEEPAAAALPASASPPPTFERRDEAASLYLGIGAGHADVVRRYFTPDSVASVTSSEGSWREVRWNSQ